MAQINQREIILLASQTLTTSGSGPDINAIQGWPRAIISVAASTMSGTLPTFNFFIQTKLGQAATTDLVGNPPSGTAIYDDLLGFSTVTTNSTRIAKTGGDYSPTNSANTTVLTTADWAQADTTIGNGTLRLGPMGGIWRVKWTVTGTTPSGVFSVVAQLDPLP
jgi:hypothetical protein